MADYIVISYNSQDEYMVRKLAHELRQRSYGVWLADRVSAEEEWERTVERVVAGSTALVVVTSFRTGVSTRTEREVQIAQREKKPLFALVIEGDDSPFLETALYNEVTRGRMPSRDFYRQLREVVSPIEIVSPGTDRQPFEPEMVLVPAGEFIMGSDPARDPLSEEVEQPQHTLYLPEYSLARTPVTNEQYHFFVRATRREPPWHWKAGRVPVGREHYPVIAVTWFNALAYARWLAETTGKPYRLPSEAEWEKGARGTDGRTYPWGDQWEVGRCNARDSKTDDVTRITAYPQGASPYGALDMAGNVWEWTRCLWGSAWDKLQFKYPYDPSDGREDESAPPEMLRVVRGGSYLNPPGILRCASRFWLNPNTRTENFGFRVVISPAQ